MADKQEILVNCRFYFEASPGIEQKMILEVSGLSAESPAAGGDKVLGSGKGAINLRQAAPTQVKFTPVTVKVVATTDLDIYNWYAACNKNDGGKNEWSDNNRKEASITVYDQAGTQKARWEIVKAFPTKYEGPKLEAGGSDVANETITVVHEGIKRVPV
ncbi:MAG TPA: phage tail protein [Cyanobacteria bacterium UBA11369]|nr:phage tail protein [Cyanobacteria bacterium UBA11371]HBE18368.1 phage tail protein [Cyanobacteria bacterium UBA11367]HBE29801.1 phage tail protein [Cyanobacteria bacterium UBA11368]HBE48415.1 phage tail protein [Cyanobacteria bacterium UBA11369]